MSRDLCPHCKQPMPERRGRVCSECDKPIRAHDRYYFVGSSVRHKDCMDPTLGKLTKTYQESFLHEESL